MQRVFLLQESPMTKERKTIYIIAGEESGDQIGGALINSLKAHCPKDTTLTFEGVGSTRMAKEGLKSLFPMAELSIMGILEIVPHILNVLARLTQTLDDIKKVKPDLVVTIDAPGFNFKIAKRLKSLNIPVIHITAPTVWAWRPRRAERVAGYLTHLLTLFHFELRTLQSMVSKQPSWDTPLLKKSCGIFPPMFIARNIS